MKISKLLRGCLVVAVTIFACKKEDTPTANNLLTDADKNFIHLAGISNFSRIQTARMAVAKTKDTLVLSYAQQLLSEGNNAQSDLRIMGTIVGFSIKDTIDAPHTALITRLDTLTGKTFDTTYIHTQIEEQQSTINFCTDEVRKGNQLNVRSYANTMLQNVQVDKQQADTLANHIH